MGTLVVMFVGSLLFFGAVWLLQKVRKVSERRIEREREDRIRLAIKLSFRRHDVPFAWTEPDLGTTGVYENGVRLHLRALGHHTFKIEFVLDLLGCSEAERVKRQKLHAKILRFLETKQIEAKGLYTQNQLYFTEAGVEQAVEGLIATIKWYDKMAQKFSRNLSDATHV